MTGHPRPRPIVVVQNNHVEHLTAPIAEAARALGIALRDVSSGEEAEKHPPLPAGGPWGPVLVFGSTHFARRWAAADPILSPWIHWTESAFDAVTWRDRLGPLMLNAEGMATTIGEFAVSDLGEMHLRPRGDMKFVGDAVRSENSTGQRSIPGIVASPAFAGSLGIAPETAIWAAPVRSIDAEVRVWMIGGRPVAASTYRVAGRMHIDASHALVPEAKLEAYAAGLVWRPADHYVVDMVLSDGAWRIVEFNPVHSAGWYDADVATVLTALIAAESQRMGGCAS